MLADDVDGAFFGCREVGKSVFGVGEAACEANCEKWWVVVDHLGVGERGEVCRATCDKLSGLGGERKGGGAAVPSSLRVDTKPMGRGIMPLMRSL